MDVAAGRVETGRLGADPCNPLTHATPPIRAARRGHPGADLMEAADLMEDRAPAGAHECQTLPLSAPTPWKGRTPWKTARRPPRVSHETVRRDVTGTNVPPAANPDAPDTEPLGTNVPPAPTLPGARERAHGHTDGPYSAHRAGGDPMERATHATNADPRRPGRTWAPDLWPA